MDQEGKLSEEHGAKQLLLQHQQLLEFTERMEEELLALVEGQTKTELTALSTILSDFIALLGEHFQAERIGALNDFNDAPDRREALLQLEGEHPALLARFLNVQSALEGVESVSSVAGRLGAAIEEFQEHEAREDALFLNE